MRIYFKFLTILFILTNALLSCNQERHKEYYNNGVLKSEFLGTKSPKKGIYKEYFKNGYIKQIDIYDSNIRIDSSIYYFESHEGQVKQISYFNDSTIYTVAYDSIGNKAKEGDILSSDTTNYRIGKWTLHNQHTRIDSVVEYVTINNKSYANQIWIKNFKGDTIPGRGNYMEIIKKDSINLGDLVRLRFILMESFYGMNSDIIIVTPKDENLLKSDYSNLFEIERDTIQSLKNDGIPRPGIPKGMPINHIAEFGIEYDEPGEHRIRGALIEYVYKQFENVKYPDSIYKVERRLFFDDSFSIREVGNGSD